MSRLTPYRVLEALPEKHRPVAVTALAARLGTTRNALNKHLATLVEQGLAEYPKKGWCRTTPRGVATRRLGPPPASDTRAARRDSLRQKLWTQLRRARKPVTAAHLAVMVSGAHDGDATAEARAYLRHLARAGFVVARPGGSPKRYLMVRYTGPACPAVDDGARRLRDRNTDEVWTW